jgi:hypothetical protein
MGHANAQRVPAQRQCHPSLLEFRAALRAAGARAEDRHNDLLDPVWNVFDVAPEGRGDFQPKLSYR